MRSIRQISRRGWLHAIWLGILVTPASAPQWNRKLSSATGIRGDVVEAVVAPVGGRVVFRADPEDRTFELFSAPIDGSQPPVLLSGELVQYGSVEPGFQVSSDGERVVFRANKDNRYSYELYSAPVDGSASPVKLHLPLTSFRDVQAGFRISPDGTRVVFTADALLNERFLLASTAIDGSSNPIILNGPLTAEEDVDADFRISPDGTRVVFGVIHETEAFKLFSTPIASAGAVQLVEGEVSAFEIDPGSERVVFRGQQMSSQWELFSVPIDASASWIRLNGSLAVGGNVFESFAFSADGDTVVYVADQDVDEVHELFAAPIDGSAAPVKPSGALVAGGDVVPAPGSFAISADERVLFLADKDVDETFELFSAPLDASAAPVQLNPALPAGGDVQLEFRISPVGPSVVYAADQDADDVVELFSVPIGGGAAVQLNPPLVAGGDVAVGGFEVGPSGFRVVYRADQESDGVEELYVAPITGEVSASKLNAPLVQRGDVSGFQFSANGARIVYLADQEDDGVVDLHSVPVNGSSGALTLNEPFTFKGPDVGTNVDVRRFLTTDQVAIYLSNEDNLYIDELFVAPAEGREPPFKLSGPLGPEGGVDDFVVAAGGSTVVYTAASESDSGLFSVQVDGIAPPIKLSSNSFSAFDAELRASPDGTRVVARDVHLFSVPVDGSASLVDLCGALPTGSRVGEFEISPDGTSVVYAVGKLYSVPIDGSAAPVQLNGALVPGGNVVMFHISVDSTRVAYKADQDVDERYELYGTPIDGSAAPVRLNGPLFPGGDVLAITVGAEGIVVYTADEQVNERYDIFGVPIDGSVSRVQLNDALDIDRDVVSDFSISPDGSRVVFRSDRDMNDVYELFSAPTDGSAAQIQLREGGVQSGLKISPNGGLVFFRAVPGLDSGLFSVPIDASAAPVRIGGDATDFLLSADGTYIAYRADDLVDLFGVPIDGSMDPVRLNGPMVAGGSIENFYVLSANGRRVTYLADQDVNSVTELYVSIRTRGIPHAGPTKMAERTQ